MTPFRFPIPPDAIRLFLHPDPKHVYHRAARIGDEVCACCGFSAIRAHRGHWMPDEYPEASAPFLSKFSAIPWSTMPDQKDDHWRPLDDARGTIAALDDRQRIQVGVAVFRGLLIRRIARLPRCNVFPTRYPYSPLYFHFNGGIGVIANLSLQSPARVIFAPRKDFDGWEIPHTRQPVEAVIAKRDPNWPPVDTTPV
jgi:hypothetical protein